MVVVLVLHHHQACDATTNSSNNNQTYCPISSCGKITNIRHPFRLKNDPSACGDPKYELSCENNVTTLTLFSGKYYLQEINYINYTIRIVDPGIEEGNCSSIPSYFLSTSNFTIIYDYDDYHMYPYQIDYHFGLGYGYIIYLNCSKPVKDDPEYVDTSPCRVNSDFKSYVYAFAGANYWEEDYWRSNKYLSVGRLKDYCKVKLVTMSALDFPG
ncbi:wall-associated receptor kinase galacturonan-binding protein, partial [Trifolium pratense]